MSSLIESWNLMTMFEETKMSDTLREKIQWVIDYYKNDVGITGPMNLSNLEFRSNLQNILERIDTIEPELDLLIEKIKTRKSCKHL